MLLIQIIYIENYSVDWEASTIPLTPILALIVVPLHRIVTRRKIDRALVTPIR
jgi:hypothetical protein